MLMLILKRGRERIGDGLTSVVPIVRRKSRKYGPTLDERAISVKHDLLITGPHSSGKTRWLTRMSELSQGIWKNRPCILIRALNPIGSWTEHPPLLEWAERAGMHWQKMRPWERQGALLSFVENQRAVILIDDLHLMTGRKGDLAVKLIRAAGVVVGSSHSEGRIPITLRMAVQGRAPQQIGLDSDAPYDVTMILGWLVALISTAAGAWPIAAVVGALHLLANGKRASRQS
jgi:hypothetical protein